MKAGSELSLVRVDVESALQDVNRDTKQTLELPLSFDKVKLVVPTPAGDRVILNDVCGHVPCGQMLAVMGPTGCGKTTLLNVLAGRLEATSGSISYGPYKWSKSLKRRVGFVEQDDIVFAELTVRETLCFAARLRLPSELSLKQKLERVDEVIASLRLTTCALSRIGGMAVRGVSGGERKRISIAAELLTRPSLMFLDEPTSGLDSSIAFIVMECMQQLCTHGVTVIASIHQPNSHIFALFSHVIFLCAGKVVYRGEGKLLLSTFSKLGHECPESHNAPDFLMDLIVRDGLDSDTMQTIARDFGPGSVVPAHVVPTETLLEATSLRYEASYWEQIKVIGERTFIIQKHAMLDVNNVILHVGLALLTGFLWFRLGFLERDIYLRSGVCLWMVSTWMFFTLFSALPILPGAHQHLRKDLSVGAYRLSAWFIATTSVHLLADIFWPTIWIFIVQYLTGVNDRFSVAMSMYALTILNVVVQQSLGIAVSVTVPEHRAMPVVLLIIVFFMAYAGFLNPYLSAGLQWTKYINLMVYTYQLALKIQFAEQWFDCAEHSSFSVCSEGSGGRISSQDVLDGAVDMPVWLAVVVLLLSMLFFRVYSYRVLRKKYFGTY